jgi:glycosyltransferase involved in cell wall biosynthesis
VARSVCFFTDSRAVGGAEAALLLLLEHLDRNAWEPTLLHAPAPALGPALERARALGVTVREVPRLAPASAAIRGFAGAVRTLRRLAPDVFHAHLSWPLAAKTQLAAAAAARIPAVVATFHLFPPEPLGRTGRLQGQLLGRLADRGIAVSDGVARELRDVLRWPPRKVEVIRNGIDLERVRTSFEPALRQALAPAGAAPLVLAVARLDPQKGLDTLLRAAAAFPAAYVAVAGDGPEREPLEREAERLGISARVRFLGSRNDVPALLAASDAFVLPSLFEGTPLALLEAMAAGRPIVASAIPGVDELVADGETALLVPPGDADALANALRRVAGDAELRQRLGAAARARADEMFSVEASTARVEALYRTLLEGSETA